MLGMLGKQLPPPQFIGGLTFMNSVLSPFVLPENLNWIF